MEETQQKTEKTKTNRGLFPSHSLMESLKIAESIKKNSNLHPYNRLDLADSLKKSPNSSGFRQLITSSTQYGLTKGSYKAEKIQLTELGKSIVLPKETGEKERSLKIALFNIPLFRKVFTKFNQGQVPQKELFTSSLNRDEDIPLNKTGSAYNVIIKNAKELGILKNVNGNDFVRLDLLSPEEATIKEGTEEEEEGEEGTEEEGTEEEGTEEEGTEEEGSGRRKGN